MFNNRSFTVVVALALLGVVTLIFGTATSTPTVAPSAIGASDWLERHPATAPSNPARPMDYATLKDAQLEQRDAVQFGSVSITAAGEEDSYLAMQKEQRAMQKELRGATKSVPSAVSAPAILARSERYATLKDAQLEQRDAMQFGTASIIVAGGWESYHAMQKEQRAMQKVLVDASAWIYPKQDPTEIQRLVDQQDAYLGQWFNNASAGCYLLPKTPDGTVEC